MLLQFLVFLAFVVICAVASWGIYKVCTSDASFWWVLVIGVGIIAVIMFVAAPAVLYFAYGKL